MKGLIVVSNRQEELISLQPAPPKESSSTQQAFALASYCTASLLMTIINKCLLSTIRFNRVFLLLFIQSFGALLLLWVASLKKRLNFAPPGKRLVRRWAPTSLLLVAMIFTSTKGQSLLPVANFTILKNISILLLVAVDKISFGVSLSKAGCFGVFLVIAGSFAGSYSRFRGGLLGHLWLAGNCIASTAYLIVMKKTIRSLKLDDLEAAMLNALLSAPLLLVLSVLFDDWKTAVAAGDLRFLWILLFLSCLSGVLISFSTAWCLRLVSTTTYGITGSLNKLPVAIAGFLLFPKERDTSAANVTSLLLVFLGGVAYALGR